jgi:O-methyltransferase
MNFLKTVGQSPVGSLLKKAAFKTGLLHHIPVADQINWKFRFIDFTKSVRPIDLHANREDLYATINTESFHHGREAVDYLEFGVFEGQSIRTWSRLNRNPQSRFVGFDSFEGLPEHWTEDRPKGFFATRTVPKIDDERVSFEVGWFQASLPPFLKTFEPASSLVVHIDCDLYSSTLFALTQLNSVMRSGTVVIFDEFYYAEHEFRALLDYCAAYMREFVLIGATKGFGQVAIRLV